MSSTAPRLGGTEDSSQSQSATQMVADQTKEKALEVREKAGSTIRSQLDQRSSEAGEQATAIAQAVRSSAQQLRSQGQDGPARLVEQLSGKLDQLGSYLSSSDSDRLLRDAEDFARRQPVVVATAAAALGFVAARFMGASSRRRYGSAVSVPRPAPRPVPAIEQTPYVPPETAYVPQETGHVTPTRGGDLGGSH